ncbi:fibronectin type 3 and ankyrin repeat domains protein 1 [Lingula anatina]|uniref:Fibronectin type 3 and ankyrin repeat domains protein 1 n=1 Tax=Lingula anatina TaxID=7574 RepID=A0A1S3KH97_LINAN|nr:fibronectin type 3 and ankyrin repeat domains protein 1 [Lingula anatina]|eukprot:XP_013422003.1 fibronectin type 3 and ankyrin repeat domains protein 1 [Lingula anatina]
MSGELSRPAPPVVGKVTHFSVELYWDEALAKAKEETGEKGGRIRVSVQEQDKKSNSWGNVYTGYSKSHVIESLDELTQYKYRLRFQNDDGPSEWSAVTTVCTTREPLTGDHLHRAVNANNLEEVERILHTGEVKAEIPDKYGFTPLMQAATKGYLDILRTLIENGADVNFANESKKTALMMACFSGNLAEAQELRKHGADYNARDKGGSMPIHWAVDGGDPNLLEWIIQDGADVNSKDSHSHWTPLIRAATIGGNVKIAEVLIKHGANVNMHDKDGKTALMSAVINGYQELVLLLLKENADVSVKNEYGKNVYEMAVSMDKRKVIKVLEDHMSKTGIKIGQKF